MQLVSQTQVNASNSLFQVEKVDFDAIKYGNNVKYQLF